MPHNAEEQGVPIVQVRLVKNNTMNRTGFTLIEMLVVITVIAILIGVSYGSFIALSRRARDDKRKADLALIRGAIGMYYSQHSIYPNSSEIPFGCNSTSPFTDAAQAASTTNTYMQSIPFDPKCPDNQYHYEPLGTNSYILGARLENTNTTESLCPGIYSCGALTCNYCLRPN